MFSNLVDYLEENDHPFLAGFVEGYMEGAAIFYIPLTIACYYWKKKAEK